MKQGLTRDDVKALRDSDFPHGMVRSDFMEIAGAIHGFWEYRGKPRPEADHIILRSGLHGVQYFNCRKVLEYTNLVEILANELRQTFAGELGRVDWVVSSAMAAITIGSEFARQIGAQYTYVEKDAQGNPTVFNGEIPEGERVLVLNELMTTGSGSTYTTKKAVQEQNEKKVEFVDFAVVMIHRSSDLRLKDGTEVRWLFHFDTQTYAPQDCPYCAAGSQVVKGKTNWAKLWAQQQGY
jgi:orotate phosphoribosyltransferase